jgi:hypothetical protein
MPRPCGSTTRIPTVILRLARSLRAITPDPVIAGSCPATHAVHLLRWSGVGSKRRHRPARTRNMRRSSREGGRLTDVPASLRLDIVGRRESRLSGGAPRGRMARGRLIRPLAAGRSRVARSRVAQVRCGLRRRHGARWFPIGRARAIDPNVCQGRQRKMRGCRSPRM